MRFALLGDHRDGLDLACALLASGRHELRLYSGPAAGLAQLQRHGVNPRSLADVEDVLADPDIEAVIVAGREAVRPALLRRALQSECHVLCVHPVDPSPDVAYEAALIQADTGRVLLPLLPMALHPGIARLAELARERSVRLFELEIWSTEEVLFDFMQPGHKPSLPGWDVLRFVGGEIGEIYLQSSRPELLPGEPLLLSGRFVDGTLLHATYLPNQADSRWRLSLVTTTGRATLQFAQGWPGPSELTYADEQGERRVETFDAVHPWPALIERFDQAVMECALKKPQPGQPADASLTRTPRALGWQDELRALELDDAARRSVERGKSNTLDLQETTEEATFKGTMTLVGCSLIWITVILVIFSVWVPWVAWFILPALGAFLVLQGLRWIVPSPSPAGPAPKPEQPARTEKVEKPEKVMDTGIRAVKDYKATGN
jgi:predicted dehydrogenase